MRFKFPLSCLPAPNDVVIGFAFAIVFAVVALSGCSPTAPRTELGFQNTQLDWDIDQIRSHITFLDGEEQEGRQTATRGFSKTAAYLSLGLRSFGLQPVLSGEYRFQYAAPVEVVSNATVILTAADTVSLVHGRDFLVEPFSEAGTISADLARLNMESGMLRSDSLWLAIGDYSKKNEERHSASKPLAIHLSNSVLEKLESKGRGYSGRAISTVEKQSSISTAPMHIAGFIAGANPVHRDSLTIVLAPADGFGLQGTWSWTDGSDSGASAAALLEIARRVNLMQSRWSLSKRTIMIAFLSSTMVDCVGPKAFYRNLPWSKSQVASIQVIVPDISNSCEWQGISGDAGISAPVFIHEWKAPVSLDDGLEGAREFGDHYLRATLLESDVLETTSEEVLQIAKTVVRSIYEQ